MLVETRGLAAAPAARRDYLLAGLVGETDRRPDAARAANGGVERDGLARAAGPGSTMEAGSFSSVTEEWARADERGRVLARPDGTGAAAAITRSNLGPLPTSTREGRGGGGMCGEGGERELPIVICGEER